MELQKHEEEHIRFLRENAGECALFLKRNDAFPLESPCSLVLVGNGAKNTIKGGTGSGDVASRFFINAYDAFVEQGFNITSTKWMEDYDNFKKSSEKDYVKDVKKNAKNHGYIAGVYSMGFFEEEKNYSFSCDYEGDACVYILSRNSGEGNDRRLIKGDVYLSDKEVEDILYLNKKFEKFLLVLNVGGVVDLSPVLEVNNILYLSQLGVVTSQVLVDIVLGKVNPSGKLASTWARPQDYPFYQEFGDLQDVYHKEGIYVGYRYFDTEKKECIFPFGYGLSYSSFESKYSYTSIDKSRIIINVNVKNISSRSGKEVVMIYLSKPNEEIDEPNQILVSYKKTKELAPGESDSLLLEFDLTRFASFDEEKAEYKLYKGNYIINFGNDITKTIPAVVLRLEEEVVVSKLVNKCNCQKQNFIDYLPSNKIEKNTKGLEVINLDLSNYETKVISYKKDVYVDKELEKLSDKELMLLTLGHHKHGFAAIVGSSCEHVVGGAGETCLSVPSISKYITMADGPAGLRLKQIYGVDKKGTYDVTLDPIMEKMIKFLPKASKPFIMPPKNRHGELHYQYTTAVPIGTALAQAFNVELYENIGKLVAKEMEIFNIHLWLAPALNIHRNILCGRNFEYYSEDPLVSGLVAAYITKGVQSFKNKGVTIKHFACNNQELNRNNLNTHISERTLREIYLKGFEICIEESKPKAIMTSYNLINGTHASESYELLNDILRCEWGYDGLIMTDWIASGRSFCKKAKYPAPYASNNILAGNDLTMSGCPKDEKDILRALKKKKISRNDLLVSSSRIYRSIKELNNN